MSIFNFNSFTQAKPTSTSSYLKPYTINKNVTIKETKIEENFEPVYDDNGGYFDQEGYYRYKDGSYYDPDGVYFDANGNKLFKMALTDANFYYEYTHPQIQIGSTVVLKDTDSVPAPNKITIKNDKGEDEVVNDLSGKFGKWNEFCGQIRIKRETVNGKQQWTVRVDKIKGGKVVASLSKTALVNSSYPTGDLNNLVLFIGQYKDAPTSAMTLTHLSVEQLNEVPAIVMPQIFRAGDKLTIDCEQNLVLLNDIPTMENVDIGSNFFSVDAGDTELKVFSDDTEVYTSVSITERWL